MRARLARLECTDNVRKAWLFWARQFLEHHHAVMVDRLGEAEVMAFLDALPRRHDLSPAARRQAFKAVRFLLEDVLDLRLAGLEAMADRLRREAGPLILTPSQVQQLLACLEHSDWLLASLVYGAGLRLLECLRLRIRDLEPDRILVRDINGRLVRETLLPARVREPIRAHQEDLKLRHIRELAEGYGGVQLPVGVLGAPSLVRSWMWQFLFPGPYMGDPGNPDAPVLRCHLPEAEGRQVIESGARQAGIHGGVTAATLRNSFAAHLIQRGVAVADVERLLGVRTASTALKRRSRESGSREPGSAPLLSPVDTLAAH
ncbi:MAG: hypothetical protein EA370_00535 [Wenzhouxiangella sp.]|nr:MAG: hypothetical protein EA370_00535 [Wenzhouxiangella sp.]